MFRITVQDCLRNVKNRFELVLLASQRAAIIQRCKTPDRIRQPGSGCGAERDRRWENSQGGKFLMGF